MNDPIEVEVVEIDGKNVMPEAPASASAPDANFTWQNMAWRDLKGKVPWGSLLRRVPLWGWVLLPLAILALIAFAAILALGFVLRLLLRALFR